MIPWGSWRWSSRLPRKLVVHATVEHAASDFLADALNGAPAFRFALLGERLTDEAARCVASWADDKLRRCAGWAEAVPCSGRARSPRAPLLEVERHARGFALVAQRSEPIRMYRTGAWSALAADDDPVDHAAFEIDVRNLDRAEQRLERQEVNCRWRAEQVNDALIEPALMTAGRFRSSTFRLTTFREAY